MQFNVEGMTCQHCVRAVERAVAALGGNARVDLGAGTVEVVGVDDAASVRSALEDAGYRVVDTPARRVSGCCGASRG